MTRDVSQSEKTVGIAFTCDTTGKILKVLRDDIGFADHFDVPGSTLSLLVDQRSLAKALNFLVALRQKRATFNWELNVCVDGEIFPLHFGGVEHNGNLLIMAAKTDNGMMQIYDELLAINNEQANNLRSAVKEQMELAYTQIERDDNLYDEISRLNNELINLQRELSKKNIELQRLNDQKNKFLSIASHDLRSPLAAISSFSTILANDIGETLDEEQREILSIIQSSSKFMLELVDNLLDVTMIERGRLELRLQPTDLVALIERSVTLNRVLAADKQLDLRFHCTGEIPEMVIDGHKIEQALNNIIGNAIKFSYPYQSIQVDVVGSQDQVMISVQDQGQGIPKDELGKLFQPFSRTSAQPTAGEKSTGLGLMIVRQIVEAHNGQIEVTSVEGEGSTFSIRLPLEGAEEIEEEPRSTSAPLETQKNAQMAGLVETVHDLPAEWLAAFKEAVEMLDTTKAEILLKQLPDDKEKVTSQLSQLVTDFRFDTLHTLLLEEPVS